MTSCLLSRRTKSLLNGLYSERKEFAPNSFFYEMTPIYMESNNDNDRVASPENVLIHLKG